MTNLMVPDPSTERKAQYTHVVYPPLHYSRSRSAHSTPRRYRHHAANRAPELGRWGAIIYRTLCALEIDARTAADAAYDECAAELYPAGQHLVTCERCLRVIAREEVAR